MSLPKAAAQSLRNAYCHPHLQALITPLAGCCQELHMQVSIAANWSCKAEVSFTGDDTHLTFISTNQALEHVERLRYLG